MSVAPEFMIAPPKSAREEIPASRRVGATIDPFYQVASRSKDDAKYDLTAQDRDRLKSGLLPEKIIHGLYLEDPASKLGIKFQNLFSAIFSAICPPAVWDLSKHPIRFLYSHSSYVSAAVLSYARPLTMVIGRGFLCEETSIDENKVKYFKKIGAYAELSPSSKMQPMAENAAELFGVMFHELLHAIVRHHLGDLENSKLEESSADLLAVGLLTKMGLNPESFLWALQKLYSRHEKSADGTDQTYLDPHPGLINREDNLRTAIGLLFPIYRGAKRSEELSHPTNMLIEGCETIDQVVSAVVGSKLSQREKFDCLRKHVDPRVLSEIDSLQLDQRDFLPPYYSVVDTISNGQISETQKLEMLLARLNTDHLFHDEFKYLVSAATEIFRSSGQEGEVAEIYINIGKKIVERSSSESRTAVIASLARLYQEWRSAAPSSLEVFDSPINGLNRKLSEFCLQTNFALTGQEPDLKVAASNLLRGISDFKLLQSDSARIFLRFVMPSGFEPDDVRELLDATRNGGVAGEVIEALLISGLSRLYILRKHVPLDGSLARMARSAEILTVSKAPMNRSETELKAQDSRLVSILSGDDPDFDTDEELQPTSKLKDATKDAKLKKYEDKLNYRVENYYRQLEALCDRPYGEVDFRELRRIAKALSLTPIDCLQGRLPGLEADVVGNFDKLPYINGEEYRESIGDNLLCAGDILNFMRVNRRNIFYCDDYLGYSKRVFERIDELVSAASFQGDDNTLNKSQRELRGTIREILGLSRSKLGEFPLTLKFDGFVKEETNDLPHFRTIVQLPEAIVSATEKLEILDGALNARVLWDQCSSGISDDDPVTISAAASILDLAHKAKILPSNSIANWEDALTALDCLAKTPSSMKAILSEAVLLHISELPEEELTAYQIHRLLTDHPSYRKNQHLEAAFVAIRTIGSDRFAEFAKSGSLDRIARVWNTYQSNGVISASEQKQAFGAIIGRIRKLSSSQQIRATLNLIKGGRIQSFDTREELFALFGEVVCKAMQQQPPLSSRQQRAIISEIIQGVHPHYLVQVLSIFAKSLPIQMPEAAFLRRELVRVQAKTMHAKSLFAGSMVEFLLDLRKSRALELESTESWSSGIESAILENGARVDQRTLINHSIELDYQILRFVLNPYSEDSSAQLLEVVGNLSFASAMAARSKFKESWDVFGNLNDVVDKCAIVKFAFSKEADPKSKAVQFVRRMVLSELQSFHEDFSNSSNFSRALLVREIIFPDKRDAAAVSRKLEPVVSVLVPEKTASGKYLRDFLCLYISKLDMRQRDIAIAALLAACQESEGAKHSGPEAFARFIEDLSALEIKAGQRAANFPKVAPEYRAPLRRLTDKAKENHLWEVLDWVEAVKPEVERQYNFHLRTKGELQTGPSVVIESTGAILGSASMSVTIEVKFSDGKTAVLSLLRPYTRERAEYSAEVLKDSLEGLPTTDRGRSIGLRILDSTTRRLSLEVDFLKTADQFSAGSENYETTDVEVEGRLVRFKVPEIYAQGAILGDDWTEYQFCLMEKLDGVPYQEWQSSQEDKRAAAIACLVKKARNIASGTFCNDRNPGNTLFSADYIGQIDFKALRLTPSTREDYAQLVKVLLLTSQKLEQSGQIASMDQIIDEFLNTQEELEAAGEPIRPFVTEVQEAILSVNHLIEGLSAADLMSALLSGLFQGAGQELRGGLLDNYDLIKDYLKVRGAPVYDRSIVEPLLTQITPDLLAQMYIKPPHQFFRLLPSRKR